MKRTAHREPPAMEVESAQLLANETRDTLRRHGLDDVHIDQLADRYVAESPGEGESSEAFIAWALQRAGRQT